jgi:hypothetical protein
MMNTNNPGDKPDDNSRDSENPPSNNQYNRSENRDESEKEHHQQTDSSGQQHRDNLQKEWNFAAELRRFLRENDWEKTGSNTNQLEFSQLFGEDLDRLVLEHKEKGKTALATLIQTSHDQIITLCSLIDPATHKGCATKHEKKELLRNLAEAKTKIEELAEIIEMLWAKFKAAERLQTESQRRPPISIYEITAKQSSGQKDEERIPVHSNPEQTKQKEFISFAEAAKLAGNVNKSTLTRWADERKIECNGKTGRERKLDKYSVMLYKQKLDEKNKKRDDRDVAKDPGN